jgi:hypothetical protein
MMTRRTWRRGRGGAVWGWELDRRGGSLVLGLYLMGLGVFMWLHQQGIIGRGFWREGWPWILVAVGAITLASARSASRVGNGVFLALLGGWFMVVKSHWHGLTIRNAWPLILVVIGVSVVMQALAGLFLPEEQPKKRVAVDETSGEEDDRDE